MAVSEQ